MPRKSYARRPTLIRNAKLFHLKVSDRLYNVEIVNVVSLSMQHFNHIRSFSPILSLTLEDPIEFFSSQGNNFPIFKFCGIFGLLSKNRKKRFSSIWNLNFFQINGEVIWKIPSIREHNFSIFEFCSISKWFLRMVNPNWSEFFRKSRLWKFLRLKILVSYTISILVTSYSFDSVSYPWERRLISY